MRPLTVELIEQGKPRYRNKTSAEGAFAFHTVREGRYHLVKRLLLQVGHMVLKLKRIAFGPLSLGSLPRGEFRVLTREEIAASSRRPLFFLQATCYRLSSQ